MSDVVERLRAGAGGGKEWMDLHNEAADDIERLRAALLPFATAVRLARSAFDAPADRGHLEAIACSYIRCNDLMNAESALPERKAGK